MAPLTTNTYRYEELQYLVCEQTDMNPVNQLLLYDNKHFSSVVAMDQPASSYPSSTPRCPLVLFSKQDDDVSLTLPEAPGKYCFLLQLADGQ